MKLLVVLAAIVAVSSALYIKPMVSSNENIEAIIAAINHPNTDPATAVLLEQQLFQILGIPQPAPEPIHVGPAIVEELPSPIAVGPEIIDFPVPDGGAVTAVKPTPVKPVPVKPVQTAPSRPPINVSQYNGLVQFDIKQNIIMNVIQAINIGNVGAVITPSPDHGAAVEPPKPVQVVENPIRPEPVIVVEDPVNVVEEPVVVVETPPEPVIVAEPTFPEVPEAVIIPEPILVGEPAVVPEPAAIIPESLN